MKEIPKWVRLGQVAGFFEAGRHMNQFDENELPIEVRSFIKQSRVAESKAWLYQVVGQAYDMPMNDLTEWIDVFPSGWQRAKLVEAYAYREAEKEVDSWQS